MIPPDQAPYAHGVDDELPKPKWITDPYHHYPPPQQISPKHACILECGICQGPTTITFYKAAGRQYNQIECTRCHATLRFYEPSKRKSPKRPKHTKGTGK